MTMKGTSYGAKLHLGFQPLHPNNSGELFHVSTPSVYLEVVSLPFNDRSEALGGPVVCDHINLNHHVLLKDSKNPHKRWLNLGKWFSRYHIEDEKQQELS